MGFSPKINKNLAKAFKDLSFSNPPAKAVGNWCSDWKNLNNNTYAIKIPKLEK